MNTDISLETVPLPGRALDWLTATFGIDQPVEFFTGMQDLGFMLSGSTALALLYLTLEDQEPTYEPGDADFFPSNVASRRPCTNKDRSEQLIPLLREHGFYPETRSDNWALNVLKTKSVPVKRPIQGLPWEPAVQARPDTMRLSWDDKPKLQIMLQGFSGMVLPWAEFDLAVLQVSLVYEDGFRLIMDSSVPADFAQRKLTWVRAPAYPIKAVNRVKKYESRGFHLPEEEKLRWNHWMTSTSSWSTPGERNWDRVYTDPDRSPLSNDEDYTEMEMDRVHVVDPARIHIQSKEAVAEFIRLSQAVL